MRQRISFWAVIMFFGALLLHVSPAFSFVDGGTFLYVGGNDPLPPLRFQSVSSGDMRDFNRISKQPLILVFLGVDIDSKRERAIEVLGDLQASLPFYRQRNVELAAVFVQPEQVSYIHEVVEAAQIGFPAYVDNGNQSFEKLGVYVMPSILMVRGGGIIHEGFGYTRNLAELLTSEVQVMLQEKTREEADADLHPRIVERSTEQRRARLDFNYALNLAQRQEIDLALEKLKMALDKDPEFVPALVEQGCLLVQKKRFQEAEVFLDRGLALAPDFPRALACKVELKNKEEMEGEGGEVSPQLDPGSWGFFADDEADEDEEVEEASQPK